ncbi:hypothetical protein FACS1894125_6080 [Actinomycetota bacterium]|nr:hypothetical protein FACS1894125_6080 [Actinomycetota bacterium]
MENTEMIEQEILALEKASREAQAKRRKSSRRKKAGAALALLALFAVGTYAFVDWSQTKFDVQSAFGDTLQVKLVADWEEATTPWTSKFVSADLPGAPLGTIKKNTSVIYEGGSNAIVRIRFMEFMQMGKDLPTTEWRGGEATGAGNSRWANDSGSNTGNVNDQANWPSSEGQRYIVGTDGKFVGKLSNGNPTAEMTNATTRNAILADLQAKYDALWTNAGVSNSRPPLTIDDIDWFVPGLTQVSDAGVKDTDVLPAPNTNQNVRYGAYFIRDSALDPNGSVGAYLKYHSYTDGSWTIFQAQAAVIRPVVENSSKLSYNELDPNNCDATDPCETTTKPGVGDGSLEGPNNDYDDVDWATDADAVAHGYVPYIHNLAKYMADGFVGAATTPTGTPTAANLADCEAVNTEEYRDYNFFNINMASYSERYGRACAESVFRQYINFNLNPDHFIMYSDWNGDAIDKWIIDDTATGYAEGWMYWGNRLTADKAISDTQILNSLRMIKSPTGDYQYSLFVSMQAVDDDSLGKWERLSTQTANNGAVPEPDLNKRAIYDNNTGTCNAAATTAHTAGKNTICDELGWVIPDKVLQAFRIDHVTIHPEDALDSFGAPFIMPGYAKSMNAYVITSPTDEMAEALNQGQQWSISAASGEFPQDGNGGIDNTDVPGVHVSATSGSISIDANAVGGTEFYVNSRSIVDPSKVASYKMTVGSAVGAVTKCEPDPGNSRVNCTKEAEDADGSKPTRLEGNTDDLAINVVPGVQRNWAANNASFKNASEFQVPSKQFRDSDNRSWRVLKEKDITRVVADDGSGNPEVETHKYALITTNFGNAFNQAQLQGSNSVVTQNAAYGYSGFVLTGGLQTLAFDTAASRTVANGSAAAASSVYSNSQLDRAMSNIYDALPTDIKSRLVPGYIGTDADNAATAAVWNQTLPALLASPPATGAGRPSDLAADFASETANFGVDDGWRKVAALSLYDALTTPLWSNSDGCTNILIWSNDARRCSNYRYPAAETGLGTDANNGASAGYWFRNSSGGTNALGADWASVVASRAVTLSYYSGARPTLWIQLD